MISRSHQIHNQDGTDVSSLEILGYKFIKPNLKIDFCRLANVVH